MEDTWVRRTWLGLVACLIAGGAVTVIRPLVQSDEPSATERAIREEQRATRALFDRYLRLECERLERQRPADRAGIPPVIAAGEM